jgi:hypothetical protein
MTMSGRTNIARIKFFEVLALLRRDLPLGSAEREDALARTLELIDSIDENKEPQSDARKATLGRLQSAIGKIHPQDESSRLVLHACAEARKRTPSNEEP